MRVLHTLMPRKVRHPVSYKLKRACGAIKSFYSFLIEFNITNDKHKQSAPLQGAKDSLSI